MDFPKALKNVPKFIIKKSKYIIGDKEYDSEYNHECARSYGLISVIPARYEEVPVYRTKGYYRKKMKKGLPKEYKQRTKIETVHYVIKRKFGDSIRSMNKINSRKEVIMKFLVYNIHRIIKENKNIINYFFKRISTRLLLR